MTIQQSVAVRNAALDAFETTAGATAVLEIRSGAQPATCATASSGTLLCAMTLPSDWMSAAASGAKAKLGTWSGTAAGTGTAAHFRIFESTATTCHMQGVVGILGGTTSTGSLTLNSTASTLTASNANIVPGMAVSGTGVQFGTTVASISGTSLVLSQNALIAGASVTLTFTSDMTIDNTSIATGQTVTATTFTLTAGNA